MTTLTGCLLAVVRSSQGEMAWEASPVRRAEAFPFWLDYLVVVLAAVVLAAAVALFTRREARNVLLFVLLPAAALGATGLTIGILVGNSLTPIANLAVSGLLTIYGGLVVFLLSKEAVADWLRSAGAISLLFVSIGIVYGASIGSAYRVAFERQEQLRLQSLDQRSKRFDADLRIWEYSENKRIDLLFDSVRTTHSAVRTSVN